MDCPPDFTYTVFMIKTSDKSMKSFQAGKIRKIKHDRSGGGDGSDEGLGGNIRSIVIVAVSCMIIYFIQWILCLILIFGT